MRLKTGWLWLGERLYERDELVDRVLRRSSALLPGTSPRFRALILLQKAWDHP